MFLRRPVPLWALLVAFLLGLLPLAFVQISRQSVPDTAEINYPAPPKTIEEAKPPAAAEPEPRTARPQPPPGPSALEEEQAARILQLEDQLAAASQAISQLEMRVEQTLNDVRLRTEENTRLAEESEEVKGQLAAARRVVEAMDTEMKGKSGRIAQLETWLASEREARKE
ncbi:MAG: hypothetical protein ACRD7E_20815, partial [Bryobacteraceae bacterium]